MIPNFVEMQSTLTNETNYEKFMANINDINDNFRTWGFINSFELFGYEDDNLFQKKGLTKIKKICTNILKKELIKNIFQNKTNTLYKTLESVIERVIILYDLIPEEEYITFIETLSEDFDTIFDNTLVFAIDNMSLSEDEHTQVLHNCFIMYLNKPEDVDIDILLKDEYLGDILSNIDSQLKSGSLVKNIFKNLFKTIALDLVLEHKEDYHLTLNIENPNDTTH